MKQFFFKHFIHIFLSFSALVFSGCSQTANYAGLMNAGDEGQTLPNPTIADKIVGNNFNLDILLDSTNFDRDDMVFSGSLSYYLMNDDGDTDNNNDTKASNVVYNDSNIINYGSIGTGSKGTSLPPITKSMRVTQPEGPLKVQLATCMRYMECDGNINWFNGDCNAKKKKFWCFFNCEYTSGNWLLDTESYDNDVGGCGNECPQSASSDPTPCWFAHDSSDNFSVDYPYGHFFPKGPIDAWDITGNVLSRSMATKVVGTQFTLSIASTNSAKTSLNVKESGVVVNYTLYDVEADADITGTSGVFYPYNGGDGDIKAQNFTINSAYRNVRIRFNIYASYDGSEYTLFPPDGGSNCSSDTQITSTPCYRNIFSDDAFAIRPDHFNLTTLTNPAISAQNVNVSLTANATDNSIVTTYSGSPTNLSTNLNSLPNGVTTILTNPVITNGSSTTNAVLDFTDVGTINFEIQDRTFAAVDLTDGSTTQDCSGAYICGDTNITFVPASYGYNNVRVVDEAGANSFTYFASDSNSRGAFITGNIQALNANGTVTGNFDPSIVSGFSEAVNLSVASVANGAGNFAGISSLTPTILAANFINGVAPIANLQFNLGRNINQALNPTQIDVQDITLNSSSTNVAASNKQLVTGADAIASNATFIYGRTHSPSYRFSIGAGVASIYFEAYCSGKDTNDIVCDTARLPGLNPTINDDPRWYINPLHVTPTHGVASNVQQRSALGQVTGTAPTNANPSVTTLTNNSGFNRFKTTMQNSASPWLLYDQYNIGDSNAAFSVEFDTTSQRDWSGRRKDNTVGSTDSTPTGVNINSVNRRLNW